MKFSFTSINNKGLTAEARLGSILVFAQFFIQKQRWSAVSLPCETWGQISVPLGRGTTPAFGKMKQTLKQASNPTTAVLTNISLTTKENVERQLTNTRNSIVI